jgi:GTP:adenosylcobinamide-phosphate guanylyltransferase
MNNEELRSKLKYILREYEGHEYIDPEERRYGNQNEGDNIGRKTEVKKPDETSEKKELKGEEELKIFIQYKSFKDKKLHLSKSGSISAPLTLSKKEELVRRIQRRVSELSDQYEFVKGTIVSKDGEKNFNSVNSLTTGIMRVKQVKNEGDHFYTKEEILKNINDLENTSYLKKYVELIQKEQNKKEAKQETTGGWAGNSEGYGHVQSDAARFKTISTILGKSSTVPNNIVLEVRRKLAKYAGQLVTILNGKQFKNKRTLSETISKEDLASKGGRW